VCFLRAAAVALHTVYRFYECKVASLCSAIKPSIVNIAEMESSESWAALGESTCPFGPWPRPKHHGGVQQQRVR